MEFLRGEKFEYLGTQEVKVRGVPRLLDIFSIVTVDEKGEKRTLCLGCQVHHKEYIDKAFNRLYPLYFPNPTPPATLTDEEVKKIAEAAVQKPEEEQRTSEDWQKVCKIEVLDADGWDRKNYQFSWCEEKITRGEFERRIGSSTCAWPEGAFDEGFNMWKDLEPEVKPS